jgi:hypothetical protein
MFGRALLAFLILPGFAAVVAPPLIALLDPWRGNTWRPGLTVMCAGAFVLLWCVCGTSTYPARAPWPHGIHRNSSS